jgi:hypothetical protein
VWGTLINELTATYDDAKGVGCQPVLLLVDEAGRTAIPALSDNASTVAGRNISLWLSIQSLSQLDMDIPLGIRRRGRTIYFWVESPLLQEEPTGGQQRRSRQAQPFIIDEEQEV